MLRRLPTLWFAVAVVLGASRAVAAEAVSLGEADADAPWIVQSDWGPLYSAMADADGHWRMRAAGPLWEIADGPDGLAWRARPRPLWTQGRDPAADRTMWEVVWPVATGKTFGQERSWRVLLAYFLNKDREDAESQYRFWVLPFWFHGRDKEGAPYAALFPLGGEVRHILWKDRIRFALWPLWYETQVNDVRGAGHLWPVYSRLTTPDGRWEKFRVFPLYTHSYREGQFEKRTMLWPIWSHARYLHPKAEGDAWVLFPLVGRVDLNTQQGWMLVPPLFQHIRGDQLTRTLCPWPFFVRETGVHERLSIWPLMGSRREGPWRRQYWLWPFIHRERHEWGRVRRDRWMLVPVYHRLATKVKPPVEERQAAEARGEYPPGHQLRSLRTKIWPLYSRHYDLDASTYRLRAPDIWPGAHAPRVERNWAPIWTLLDYRVRGDASDLEVLWGLYRDTRRGEGARAVSLFPLWRHERVADADARRWSVLKGLIGYDRTATTRRVRLLWLGRVRLPAAADAEEPLETEEP